VLGKISIVNDATTKLEIGALGLVVFTARLMLSQSTVSHLLITFLKFALNNNRIKLLSGFFMRWLKFK
jgi:hypothetical protein